MSAAGILPLQSSPFGTGQFNRVACPAGGQVPDSFDSLLPSMGLCLAYVRLSKPVTPASNSLVVLCRPTW